MAFKGTAGKSASGASMSKYDVEVEARLQALEKDYHDKKITFLSISVDTDRDAWLKMIKDKNLTGVQLWANGWSSITELYAIFGIPRFLLFDENGKIISTDAPRPTNNDIRDLFDSYLN